MSDTYSAVDDSDDVDEALGWQERVNSWAAIKAYKRRTYELLAGARPVLDVGCGVGSDLGELGEGALGVDASLAMCQRARARGALACQGDIDALPFPAGAFGGVRCDRVLQHVADPVAAVHELVRVTQSGGRIVLSDPDQESLVLAVPGARPELVAEVKRLRRDAGYRNGTLARQLPELLIRARLVDVTVDAYPLLLTDPEDAFGLPGWVRYWREHGNRFTQSQVSEWEAAVTGGGHAGFVFALLYLVVSGKRV